MLNTSPIVKILARRQFVITMFFIVLIVLGAVLHRDYGMGVDEPIERANGMISLNYIADRFGISALQKDELLQTFRYAQLETYKDRDYPVLFNLPAAFLEWALNIEDEQTVYWYRHLLNYLVCLVGVYAIFRLAERRFTSWQVGLLTATLYLVSPRFFAESFYNSKDLIFLTFFAIATNTLVASVMQLSRWKMLLHGLATALAINVRIMGVALVFITLAILLLQALKKEITWAQATKLGCWYLGSAALMTYLLWPWLWSNPIGNLLMGFSNMAHFRLEMAIPYLGQSILSTEVPWHYIPVYFLITTPIVYSLFFIVGAGGIIQKLLQAKWRLWSNKDQLQDLIFLGLFIAPVIAVISMHSVLYNGWRQMYFIYPAFLLVVMRGIICLWNAFSIHALAQQWLRALIGLLVASSVVLSAAWMMAVHPFQHLYFNSMAGKNWSTVFEADYWALTQQHLLKEIASLDDRPIIRVYGIWQDVLPKAQRARIAKVDLASDADYVVQGAGSNAGQTGQIIVEGQLVGSYSKQQKNREALPPLQVNEKIGFGTHDKGIAYLLAVGNQAQIGWGWSHPESWGVWSDGYQAKLLLPVPKERPKQLVLDLRAFIGPSQPTQNLQIWINRQLAGNYHLSLPENQIVIPLSPKMRERNYIEVLFQFSTTISPAQLGTGEDHRRLAVGLVSAQFQ